MTPATACDCLFAACRACPHCQAEDLYRATQFTPDERKIILALAGAGKLTRKQLVACCRLKDANPRDHKIQDALTALRYRHLVEGGKSGYYLTALAVEMEIAKTSTKHPEKQGQNKINVTYH